MKYTVDYYDDEDRRPFWGVTEWVANELGGASGRLLEKCSTEVEAESLARAYNAIAIYEADPY